MTQASASTTFDLPDPFGPTTAQMPGSNFIVVEEAKDLKPFSVNDFKCIVVSLPFVEAFRPTGLTILRDYCIHAPRPPL